MVLGQLGKDFPPIAPPAWASQNYLDTMSFPLGKTIFALICVAVASGAVVLFHAPPQPADIVLWVFADPHARMYRGTFRNAIISKNGSLLDQFQKETGHSVRRDW